MLEISTELGAESDLCHPKNMAAASGCQDDGNMQKSPLMGSLKEQEGQHPVLEVYYSHMS